MIANLGDSEWTYGHAAHLASRCIIGASRDEISALFDLGRTSGVEAAVDSLVAKPDDWDDFPFPDWWDGQDVSSGGPTGSITESGNLLVSWYLNQLLNANPLGAKMFKFFLDHAPIDERNFLHQNKWIYFFQYFDICRKHSLGNFKQLVSDVSWSGGMIWMLNLNSNLNTNLNENFGRELLELFTLGVGGGYTEKDVQNVSRAFTGRQTRTSHPADHPYTPFLADNYVDIDELEVLGKTFPKLSRIPGSVREHGPAVLDHIFEQPAAGTYLTWKLWRYFVGPNPPEGLIAELGARFQNTHNFELRPLLKEIFMSRAFYAEENRGNQIKDAADFFISCIKKLRVSLPSPMITYIATDQLGYNPMIPPNIAGWPEPEAGGNAWIGPEKILARINLPTMWLQKTLDFFPQSNLGGNRSLRNETAPTDFDLDKLVPAHLRNPRDFNLLIDELNDHFLPFHPLSKTQRDILTEAFATDYRQIDYDTQILELIRTFTSLPEFQLQ
ncbi:MAG: DUF1800 family protein [Verrucomicrobiaceae bacterium]